MARATIYRNWPQPADLIEVLVDSSVHASRLGITVGGFRGDLRGDLHAAMEMLRTSLDEQPVRAFFAGCLEYGRRSEQVADATERYGEAVLAPFDVVLTAAVDNGEIDGDVDALVAEVAGPVLLQHVLLGRTVSRHQSRAVVDRFLAAHTSR